ncbi:hypothetical protein [Streptomyces sp. NPDC058678]|uniref:hypothetical protein n=1 Tax=Streptomyces sp. NPDC058678 TaxID=3346595 RepID=UPI00365BAFE7
MINHRVDLASAVDRVGATYDTERAQGELNAWGNSFPAEELPFGGQVNVGGVFYALVEKAPQQPDHLEALGQMIACGPPSRPVDALALLATGELGPQKLSIRVHLAGGDVATVPVAVPGWLVRPDAPVTADQLRCSHLHYPGGYELARLLPVLWSRVLPLPGLPITALELLVNPLVHVFAISLLAEVEP